MVVKMCSEDNMQHINICHMLSWDYLYNLYFNKVSP